MYLSCTPKPSIDLWLQPVKPQPKPLLIHSGVPAEKQIQHSGKPSLPIWPFKDDRSLQSVFFFTWLSENHFMTGSRHNRIHCCLTCTWSGVKFEWTLWFFFIRGWSAVKCPQIKILMLGWENGEDEDLAVLHQIKAYIQRCGIVKLTFVILLGIIDINVQSWGAQIAFSTKFVPYYFSVTPWKLIFRYVLYQTF